MEMDNFRSRSFDRSNSRQPGLTKKPRLAEDLTSNNSNRPFSSRPPPSSSQPPSAAGAVSARFRGDRDSDSVDSSRGAGGGGYQPQNLQQQQQQHQELINQYKTALDELTFNSKPIITNLTIIAGENLLAAKAIASAICGNILEVPSDQKLPSLYLLDSIVKNIGRDYIKHFGAKLPEVFCKTYKQVESSLQSSMRHLFGTWKGVFPSQSLQMIEKELGFTTAANGSSSGATASRPDSQSLRQPQSIHVNPKYLEARQLQQSSRAKGTNDISGTLAKDAERPDRSSSIIGGRPWADRSVNKQSVQHLQRETTRQHEKSSSVSYEDYDYDSELSGRLGKRIGRDSVSITEPGQNKQIYGARSSVAETVPRQRNGIDIKDKVPNFMAPRVANPEMSRSWKNSEEDEYMWDDLNSRLMDFPAANNSTKARSSSDKLERGNYLRRSQHDVGSRTDRESSVDSLSTEMENQTAFSHPVSPQLPVPVLQAADPRRLLVAANSSLAKAKLQPQLESSHKGSSGVGFSKKSLTDDASPPRKSAILQRHLSSSLSAHPPQRELHHFDEQELPQAESLKKSQGTKLQKSAPVLQPLQKRQPSSTQQPKLEQKQSETPSHAQKPPMVQVSMDVILKSGLSKGSQPKLDSLDTNAMPSELDIPPLPSGSSSTQFASSAGTKVSNPLSNLLSSLVAKGLISSSNADTPKIVPSKVPISSSSSKPLPSLPVSSVPVSTSSSEVSVFKPSTKPSAYLTQSITTDIKNLIGFEFKPDKIREFHPSVITDLFDDLPHQCTICGLRLKLEERLDRHLEWHASQKNASKSASREWFVDSGNWVSREKKATPKSEPVDIIEENGNIVEMIEQQNHPMVPADEDQCLCILCGELYEDFYCQESDQWMFIGAAYMPQGLIVHVECMSDNSAHDLGMTDAVKVVDLDL